MDTRKLNLIRLTRDIIIRVATNVFGNDETCY